MAPFLHTGNVGLGFTLSANEVQDIVVMVNPLGMIDFEQFADIVEDLSLSDRDVRRELTEAFASFDPTRTGFITLDSLRLFCQKVRLLGVCLFCFYQNAEQNPKHNKTPPQAKEVISETELRQMIMEANTSSTGQVTLEEFIAIMMRTNIYRR
jgi:Ca2+-binding EF-hand superfamily protein